jgi:hypothetical protein
LPAPESATLNKLLDFNHILKLPERAFHAAAFQKNTPRTPLFRSVFLVKMIKLQYITIVFTITILPFVFITAPADAKTVIDQLGRHITVSDNPERIVSLAPSITEIVFAL